MFKLVKMINSGVNVPEPKICPKSYDFEVVAGVPLSSSCNEIIPFSSGNDPAYMAIKTYEEIDNPKILCYKIDPNMIFEVPFIGNPQNVHVGDMVEMYYSVSFAVGVTEGTENPAVEIYDLCGATKSGDKIHVRFLH